MTNGDDDPSDIFGSPSIIRSGAPFVVDISPVLPPSAVLDDDGSTELLRRRAESKGENRPK